MREILFRGKRIDTGEWIYGNLVQFPVHGVVRIVEQEPSYKDAAVDPDTIGQYTGLTDKNGKKFFEGDIIVAKFPDQTRSVSGIVKYGEFKDVDSCDTYHYLGFYIEIWGHCISILEPMNDGIELEVIGNIHDNPELVEVR